MIEALLSAAAPLSDVLWTFGVVFLRVGAMMALLPAFGEMVVPARVRIALAMAFALIVWPAVDHSRLPEAANLMGYVTLLGAESVTGLFFGILLRLFVIALQIAGTIAAQSTSLSQIFGGTAGADPLPAMGHVLLIGGLALAVILGLHVRIAEYILQSYVLVPAGQVPSPSAAAEAGLVEVSRAFSFAFSLAAPFLVASLLYNVTLGAINRAMPQLMVAFVGAPAITAGGLLILFLTAPVALSIWSDNLFTFLGNPFGGPR